jgi:hypothetical protein
MFHVDEDCMTIPYQPQLTSFLLAL